MKNIHLPRLNGAFQRATNPSQPNLEVFKTDATQFTILVNALVDQHYRLAWLFGTDDRKKDQTFGVHAILSPDDGHNEWIQVSATLAEQDPKYPALTTTIMGAIWFEKYLMDMFGIVAEGHPDPRRLVHHENVPLNTYPLRKDFAWDTVMKHDEVPYPMLHVEGNGVYEIPVGPIHAGIIEPGHFRFNVAGERILNLEGKLFFTHKGVEKLLEGKTVTEALLFVERISDDTAASHALAFAQAVERIAQHAVSSKIDLLRTLIVELERVTMHIHDLANMAGMGTGYTIMAAHGFRIKETLVRLSEKLLKNRFWRGYIIPGGVARSLNSVDLRTIRQTVARVVHEMHGLLKIGLESDGLMERLETTGVLKTDAARAYSAVGVPARASGVDIDVRRDHPYAAYGQMKFQPATRTTGDVHARFMMRVSELEASSQMIETIIQKLLRMKKEKTQCVLRVGSGEALGAVEGWRGEILH
ncbi:MAG TPA: NADH-quinone oxidoreductase subunit C, partial [Patescibacteria group bacterium]|nr:NADH-quinone oxidoreductase subunit C [Patescibacteria group bacterium]